MTIIYNDLKYQIILLDKIYEFTNQIKSLLNFLITEFYFTNIIVFESKKKKIIHNLLFIKNIFYKFNINNFIIVKINKIINITKLIIYPAYLNLNNMSKYTDEINKITTIKFYHKPETIDVKNSFYDEEIELDESEISNINSFENIQQLQNNENSFENIHQLQNNENHVIGKKITGKKFLNIIDFTNSFIII